MQVKEIVSHILYHVDAETRGSDASQAPGLTGRARLVRRVLGYYLLDDRELTTESLFQELTDNVPGIAGAASLRRTLIGIKDRGDIRPQLMIQAWVGKSQEGRGG